MGCECGAHEPCLPVWHEALATEHGDSKMARWHNPLVCSFLLQHKSAFRRDHGNQQFQFLQLFLDRGIEVVNETAKRLVEQNSGISRTHSYELDSYQCIPGDGFPSGFSLSIHNLKGPKGFIDTSHLQYGQRMAELCQSTVDGWMTLEGFSA